LVSREVEASISGKSYPANIERESLIAKSEIESLVDLALAFSAAPTTQIYLR